MVPVARFHGMDEVEAFRGIAEECGVVTQVANVERTVAGFDATLGGTAQFMGFVILVAAAEVPVLKAHLEAGLEIDPMDPMQSASTGELLAMTGGPVDGNLCEKIVAERILASRAQPAVETAAAAAWVDTQMERDRKLARWLGMMGWVFTIIYLSIVLNGLFPPAHLTDEQVAVMFAPGARGWVPETRDQIADNLRPFILTVIPMATGIALWLSRRQMRNGLVRPMFPPFWRITGAVQLWLPVVLIGGATALRYWDRMVLGGGK